MNKFKIAGIVLATAVTAGCASQPDNSMALEDAAASANLAEQMASDAATTANEAMNRAQRAQRTADQAMAAAKAAQRSADEANERAKRMLNRSSMK
jgi:hypothetical protein